MSSLLSRSELKTSAVSMDKDKEKEKQKLFSRLRASRRRPWSVLPPSRRRRRRGRGRIGPRPSEPQCRRHRRRPSRPLLRLRWPLETHQRGRSSALSVSLRRARPVRPPQRREEEEGEGAVTFFDW